MTYTVRELAERWQCDQRMVLRAIADGRLQAFSLRPGARRPTWRIPEAEVERFEAGGRPPEPAAKPVRRRRQPADVIKFF